MDFDTAIDDAIRNSFNEMSYLINEEGNSNLTFDTMNETTMDEYYDDYLDGYYDGEDDDEGIDTWQHNYDDYNIILSKDNPVDDYLLKVFTEEIRYIHRVTTQQTKNCSMHEILSLFLAPLIPVIVGAVNASSISDDDVVNHQDAVHFVQCIIALSVYRVTPTNFFGKPQVYPLLKGLNFQRFHTVLMGLNRKRQSMNADSEILWDKPFSEDPSIREGEEAMTRINRNFFVPNTSILSVDDDHLRLSAADCEEIGLPRKNNPQKAFGPVSTGVVSLTSGLTLGTRIAGRSESDVTTVRILCKNIFNKELPEQVQSSNLVAMDRGYLSQSMIEYLSSAGFSIIGTHKRVQNYPFTFGYNRHMGKRIKIEEHGAKMSYWAKKKDKSSGKLFRALAYRSGKGHVATVFTSSPEINAGHYIYKFKKM